MNHFPWTWSEPHGDWYYATEGPDGTLTYHWSRTQKAAKPAALSSTSSQMFSRLSSGNSIGSMTNPTQSVPLEMRVQIKDFVAGKPQLRRCERLESSYRIRTGAEACSFFHFGKVFSTLHVQAAGGHTFPTSDNITIIQFGERAFSQIRWFVIVEVRRRFVYACMMSTYHGRATLHPGCVPSEHSAVYLDKQFPILLEGEHLTKEPICVIPSDPSISMDPKSRINYAKVFPIEMNVKVKDIGDVDPKDLHNLHRYYKEANPRD